MGNFEAGNIAEYEAEREAERETGNRGAFGGLSDHENWRRICVEL
jgi:hypothetical protein